MKRSVPGLALALGGLFGVGCGVSPDSGAYGFGSAGMPQPAADTQDEGDTDVATATEGISAGTTPAEETTGDDGGSTSGEPLEETTSDGGTGDEDTDGGSTGGVESGVCGDMACQGAMPAGSVSGDEASPALSLQGWEDTWISFEVTEDNHDIAGEELAVRVNLQSPAGADFDLYVFTGPTGGGPGCNGEMHASTTAGVETVQLGWGESTIANGNPDGRFFAVQVVRVDGQCASDEEWFLTIEGDT